MSNIHKNFNSRTRVGATQQAGGLDAGSQVSIHAPVWVRRGGMSKTSNTKLFQFTHPCGCDRPLRCRNWGSLSFNSRTRVGATHEGNCPFAFEAGFNSRTRVGATGGSVADDEG